jgi:gluconolactonase
MVDDDGLNCGSPGLLSRRAFVAAAASAAFCAAGEGLAAEPAIAVHRLSPLLDRWIARTAVPEVIATGFRWAEGPLWLPSMRALLVTDPPANVVRRWTRATGLQEFLRPSGLAAFDPKLVREPGLNGLALDGSGRLVGADSGNRGLVAIDLATRRRTPLVDRYRGRRFNSPNDLHVARDGSIWFTDPPYGLADAEKNPLRELAHNGVYRWRAGREAILVDGELSRPNGIALSPDERRLFVTVSDPAGARIMSYDLDRRGEVKARRVFLDMTALRGPGAPGLPDGIKVARDGTLFCTGPGGLHILSPEGERMGLVSHGGPIANCAFGENGRTLFMAANNRVLRLPLLISASR